MPENINIDNESSQKLDKEVLQEIMNEAVKNYHEEKEKEKNLLIDDVDVNDEDKVNDVPNDIIDLPPTEDGETEIDNKLEDVIDITGNSEILNGINVNVDKNDEGDIIISLQAGDFNRTEKLDKDNLLESICSTFTSFIQDTPIEDSVDNPEEIEQNDEDINKDLDNLEDEKDEDEDKNKDDDKDDDKDKEEEDDEMSDSALESSILNLSSLRDKYSDKVEEVFNHGLEAKAIVLDMIKDNILANSIGELLNKSKEKDTLIASKKEELEQSKINFITAKKMNLNMVDVYNTLVASIDNVNSDLANGLISSKTAKKCLDNYNTIISKVLVAKKPETLLASITQMEKIDNALLASRTNKNKKSATVVANDISKKQVNDISTKDPVLVDKQKNQKPVMSGRNVMNRDGMSERTLSERHRGFNTIDQMTAEITRIAGI